jgi:hypothetical protein
MTKWTELEDDIRAKTPEFKVVHKSEDRRSKILSKFIFWMPYMDVYTTSWPKFLVPDTRLRYHVGEHEWVHLIDQETFFGLLPKFPKRLNLILFFVAYGMPQLLSLLSVLAFISPLFLLSLLFLLPLPSPVRMWAEMRAFRRSVELGRDPDLIVKMFIDKTYFFMWPFKKHVLKMLKKPSPYKEMMDSR